MNVWKKRHQRAVLKLEWKRTKCWFMINIQDNNRHPITASHHITHSVRMNAVKIVLPFTHFTIRAFFSSNIFWYLYIHLLFCALCYVCERNANKHMMMVKWKEKNRSKTSQNSSSQPFLWLFDIKRRFFSLTRAALLRLYLLATRNHFIDLYFPLT